MDGSVNGWSFWDQNLQFSWFSSILDFLKNTIVVPVSALRSQESRHFSSCTLGEKFQSNIDGMDIHSFTEHSTWNDFFTKLFILGTYLRCWRKANNMSKTALLPYFGIFANPESWSLQCFEEDLVPGPSILERFFLKNYLTCRHGWGVGVKLTICLR